MVTKLWAAALTLTLLVGVACAADDRDLAGDNAPAVTAGDTYLFTSDGTVATQTNDQIAITAGDRLVIGADSTGMVGQELDYVLDAITSRGPGSALEITVSPEPAAGLNGTYVYTGDIDFLQGGEITIADGSAATPDGSNALYTDFLEVANTAINLGDYTALGIAAAGAIGQSSVVTTTGVVESTIFLGDGVDYGILTLNGATLDATAAPLTIESFSTTDSGLVIFSGAASTIKGTVDASTVDTVIDGTGGPVVNFNNAYYTTNYYTHNGGNVMGTAVGNVLHVLKDADLNGGMVRVDHMIVDGTYTINAGGTGHATNLTVGKMAAIQSGAVDMIMNHTIRTGDYTILGDAFVKGCRMVPLDANITFETAGSALRVERNGILSTLENNIVIEGDGIGLGLGGYYLTDHNVGNSSATVGFNSISGMNHVEIADTAALVLGERQQYYYNAGKEIFVGDDVILQTVADGATAGTINGMFGNVRQLTSNSWGYSSYFGDFELVLKKDAGNDVLSIDGFTASNYKNYAANQAQLAKMGLNASASFGVLQNLQQLAVDLATEIDAYAPNYVGKAPEFGLSYDAGSWGGYNTGLLRVSGADDVAIANNVAGRLNRDMYSSVVNGSRVFQTNRGNGDDYIGFINGSVDNATWEYMNAATVNNVVRANQRAMLTASDMVYDRLAGYGYNAQNVYAAVGSDYGLAAAILNANYLNRFWVSGIGQWDDADDRGGWAGYDYDSWGFATGYDRAIGGFIVGGSFAYTTGDFEDNSASGHDSDIDNYAFNLYATYNHCSGFFGTLVGGYTYSDNDINELRGGNWAEQNFHTNTWYVSGKFGYNWRPTKGLTLTPSVGLGYIHSRASNHDGIYAGIANQRFGKIKADTGFLPVELRANYDWCVGPESTFSLNAKVGYTYNFDEDAASGSAFLYGLENASPIRAVGRDMGHSAWNLGVGAKYTYKRFDFGVNYDYVGMSDFDSHRVTATVGVGF